MAKKEEKPPIYAFRRGNALYGELQQDRERIQEMPEGMRVRLDERVSGRNMDAHRWYWAFLREVVKATGCAPTENALHQLVKLKTGHTDDILVGGYIVKVPASISFASMDEPTFSKFRESAVQFIAETYGVTPESIGEAA